MTSIKKITEKLKAPFPANEIKWRAQRITQKFKKDENEETKYQAFMLAYIDARAVMDRLDDAVGVNNWQTTFTETDKGRVLCSLSIKLGDTWVTKTDGAGDTGAESEKGAISDALKRAAVNFGINRVMYSFGDTRVELSKDDIRIKNGKPIYKYGAAKLSEKCRLPQEYLELFKEQETKANSKQQPKEEPKEETKEETALEIVKDIVKIESQQKDAKKLNDQDQQLYTESKAIVLNLIKTGIKYDRKDFISTESTVMKRCKEFEETSEVMQRRMSYLRTVYMDLQKRLDKYKKSENKNG